MSIGYLARSANFTTPFESSKMFSGLSRSDSLQQRTKEFTVGASTNFAPEPVQQEETWTLVPLDPEQHSSKTFAEEKGYKDLFWAQIWKEFQFRHNQSTRGVWSIIGLKSHLSIKLNPFALSRFWFLFLFLIPNFLLNIFDICNSMHRGWFNHSWQRSCIYFYTCMKKCFYIFLILWI